MQPPSTVIAETSSPPSPRNVATPKTVTGEIVSVDGKKMYRIGNVDRMPEFFISLVSSSDHWCFLSSRGALSAGRKSPETALFPYYTVDKIYDNRQSAGPVTYIRIRKNDQIVLWEPFRDHTRQLYSLECNLYKSLVGDSIIFEEINHDLQLTFRYSWLFSDRWGFIRKAELINNTDYPVSIEILDGLRNLMPPGVDRRTQNEYSCLTDAYKHSQLLKESNLAIYRLAAGIIDQAIPLESLKATTVWSTGFKEATILLSDHQIESFLEGKSLRAETDLRAHRGAFLKAGKLDLMPLQSQSWSFIAEVQQTQKSVIALKNAIEGGLSPADLEADVMAGGERLWELVATADGIQTTNNAVIDSHHYSNVMFNIMRGGVFADGYNIKRDDFLSYLQNANKQVFQRHGLLLKTLPQKLSVAELKTHPTVAGDKTLYRHVLEYLPITFSRRHGDPSRPWNRFTIDLKDETGNPKLSFEGNWRDIFQNWEALLLSYPHFIDSVITKFLNATTADGYNPYRITRNGIDWETEDPHDPWASTGYWGDHQITYLLRLLKLEESYFPGKLAGSLQENHFVYANVPYKIKGFADTLKNPRKTIDFDHKLHGLILKRESVEGSDARLLTGDTNAITHATLLEKLLTPALVKLTNFVPDGGIWMNTQRPEWNDANNALAGYGVSMVTLYYLCDYLHFLDQILEQVDSDQEIHLNTALHDLLQALDTIFTSHRPALTTGGLSGELRLSIMRELGTAGEKHRTTCYEGTLDGSTSLSTGKVQAFLQRAREILTSCVHRNRREDGLYHSYNLLDPSSDLSRVEIRKLQEMLEGQVAVLSSGCLTPAESAALLKSLRKSVLYRPDQQSYILYPDRQLPDFLDKAILAKDKLTTSPLLSEMLKQKDERIVLEDEEGNTRFSHEMVNELALRQAINKVSDDTRYAVYPSSDWEHIVALYEETFQHRAFTGRSGNMFGYEGLGSIYWHMVSKLMVAAQENYLLAEKSSPEQQELLERYRDIQSGLSFRKSPEKYGAFPADAYSHTPAHAGAQQPGLTGQVKEGVIARLGELGLRIRNGQIQFDLSMLRREEFITSPARFEYLSSSGERRGFNLPAGSLAFTFCQVAIVYRLSASLQCTLHYNDGNVKLLNALHLDKQDSAHIFNRSDKITRIIVEVPEPMLRS